MPAPGDWQIVAIQESKENRDRFAAEHFIPAMSKGIPGGFTSPPIETTGDVTHFYK